MGASTTAVIQSIPNTIHRSYITNISIYDTLAVAEQKRNFMKTVCVNLDVKNIFRGKVPCGTEPPVPAAS